MPSRISLHNKPSTDFRVLVFICLLVIGAGIVASAKAWSKLYSAVPAEATASPPPPAVKFASALFPQTDRLQRELITIHPTGFDPSEIRRPPGVFLLAVDNKSGLDQVTLRITREDGVLVRELRLSPERFKLREKINLQPGEYLLTEADHANWRCRVTIAP